MGVGSLVCAMPHFISAPWEFDNSLNTSDVGQCTDRFSEVHFRVVGDSDVGVGANNERIFLTMNKYPIYSEYNNLGRKKNEKAS